MSGFAARLGLEGGRAPAHATVKRQLDVECVEEAGGSGAVVLRVPIEAGQTVADLAGLVSERLSAALGWAPVALSAGPCGPSVWATTASSGQRVALHPGDAIVDALGPEETQLNMTYHQEPALIPRPPPGLTREPGWEPEGPEPVERLGRRGLRVVVEPPAGGPPQGVAAVGERSASERLGRRGLQDGTKSAGAEDHRKPAEDGRTRRLGATPSQTSVQAAGELWGSFPQHAQLCCTKKGSLNLLFYRAHICKEWARGVCMKGDRCTMAHGPGQLLSCTQERRLAAAGDAMRALLRAKDGVQLSRSTSLDAPKVSALRSKPTRGGA